MTATTRSLQVGDIAISIAEAGAGGRPLLLQHGFLGAKEDFADWFDRLAERGWHVVAPDLRGHGASDHPAGRDAYSLELLTSDLIGVVDALDWKRCTLVGHSLGGMIAQEVAVDHPDRLDALVLMDTISGPVSGGGASFAVLGLLLRVGGPKAIARLASRVPPKSPDSVRRLYAERPGYVEWVQGKFRNSSKDMAVSLSGQLRDRPDRTGDLRRLDLPTLVIVGEHDMPGFVDGSRRMADAIPGSRFVIIDGAAHQPQLETPDAWWQALTDFLDEAAATDDVELTPDEQAALTAGTDLWHTAGVERLGIEPLAVTDGPSGARGSEFTGATSALMPCGTALASTWNPELIREVGELLGDEARSKHSRVLLAPTVNIHRHPLGGRNFECYSEDPHLTAAIAVAFIEGVQSRGVACAVKHFAANDQETDRMNVDVVVDEQVLREIYLVPFEAAVRRANVWAVMAAYNRLGGAFCSEHRELLTEILRDEWGFDGLVVSDWFGVHSVAAIEAGLDLEMPGPAQTLGAHLPAAVERGDVAAATVERSARRMLHLMERTTTSLGEAVDPQRAAATGRRAASEAIVLLRNDGVLPLDPERIARLAVLGPRADNPHVQGGGSAQVTPPYVVTPLRGIVARAASASVVHEAGRVDLGAQPIDARHLASGDDATPGSIQLDFHPAGRFDLPPVCRRSIATTNLIWIGEPAPGVTPGNFSARATASFVPERSGTWTFTLTGSGDARVSIDGRPLLDNAGVGLGGGFMGLFSAARDATIDLIAGTVHELVAEIDMIQAPPGDGDAPTIPGLSLAGLTVEVTAPPQPDAVALALAAARDAEVAVVVVGQDTCESEGTDHATIDLPADQVALIREVAAANPATVVVINTGSPVSTEWADDVAAVVQMSYAGQEAGAALAAVLFGDVDASGRLPTTYPHRIEDTPAFGHFPGGDGTVEYAEGMLVGYRYYDTRHIEPSFCFGHGLSYTTFAYASPGARVDGQTAVVSVDIANTGGRPGREVVQVYVRAASSSDGRPDRELKAFQKVELDPGETATVSLPLDERAFAHWDRAARAWQVEPGDFDLLIGSSSRDIHHTLRVRID